MNSERGPLQADRDKVTAKERAEAAEQLTARLAAQVRGPGVSQESCTACEPRSLDDCTRKGAACVCHRHICLAHLITSLPLQWLCSGL